MNENTSLVFFLPSPCLFSMATSTGADFDDRLELATKGREKCTYEFNRDLATTAACIGLMALLYRQTSRDATATRGARLMAGGFIAGSLFLGGMQVAMILHGRNQCLGELCQRTEELRKTQSHTAI